MPNQDQNFVIWVINITNDSFGLQGEIFIVKFAVQYNLSGSFWNVNFKNAAIYIGF